MIRLARPLLAAFALLVIALAGCGRDDGPASGVFEDLLRAIPDTPETRQYVVMTDLARLREILGVELPQDASIAQIREYVSQLSAPEQPIRMRASTAILYDEPAITRVWPNLSKYAGLDLSSVDQAVEAGGLPERYYAVRGRFDPKQADSLLSDCEGCSRPLERGEYLASKYYSWGADAAIDLELRYSPPAADQLGRGGRLFVEDEYVLRTIWTRGIEEMITALHAGASLAADEDFRLAARGLDEMAVVTALISDFTQGPQLSEAGRSCSVGPTGYADCDAMRVAWNPPANTPVLRPYLLMALGEGLDGARQPFLAVILVHASEADARQNMELLRGRIAETRSLSSGLPWSTHFETVEVVVDGRVLTARLVGSSPGVALWPWDPLLLHE